MASTNTLRSTIELLGSGVLKGAALGSAQRDALTFGNGDWHRLVTALTTGTSDVPTNGIGTANQWFAEKRTLAAGANDDLDLAGGLTNHLGQVVTFTKVKKLVVAIVSADGVKKLRVGPQAVANAFVGPFGGAAGATIYKVIDDWEVLVNNKWAGYAVGAGATDVLRINNPGAGPVDYLIWIEGVQ